MTDATEKGRSMTTDNPSVEALREALKPFAAVAEKDIGADEADSDLFQVASFNYAPKLRVGDFRRALATLSTTTPQAHTGTVEALRGRLEANLPNLEGLAETLAWGEACQPEDTSPGAVARDLRALLAALASTPTPQAPASAEVGRPLDPLERLHCARELLATEYDRIGHTESAELVRRGRADECDLAAERAVFAALSKPIEPADIRQGEVEPKDARTISWCAKVVRELGTSMSPGALAAALDRHAAALKGSAVSALSGEG